MDPGHSCLQTMPFDILGLFLKLLLSYGFEAFYTFFKAWSQSQRSNMISGLLDTLCVRSLYKYGNVGTHADVACFHRFIAVGVHLRTPDAIVYACCRDLIRLDGDFEANFVALTNVANVGHFLGKVAHFILSIMYGRHTSLSGLEALVDLHKSPHYRFQISGAVSSVELIFSSISPSCVAAEVPNKIACPFHPVPDNDMFRNDWSVSELCFFCEVAWIFNRFTKKVQVPVPMR